MWLPDTVSHTRNAYGPQSYQAYPSSPTTARTLAHVPPQPSSNIGTVMIAAAAATCGIAGFVPPLWAARQRADDVRFRKRMYALSAASAVMTVLGLVFIGTAQEDATGSPTGVLSDIGTVLVLVNLALSVTVAVLVRNTGPSAPLPGVAEGLARRRLREQYRQVAISDPPLARSMGVGRPDLLREIDDGGLLDINTIPADRLGQLAGLSEDEARRIADARAHIGRFLSLEDLAVYADLPQSTIDLLRERVIIYGS